MRVVKTAGMKYLGPFSIKLLTWITVLVCSPILVEGTELYGRFTSELYTWQSLGKDHIRPYERLNATLIPWRGKNKQYVAIRSNIRWTTDLKDKLATDPGTFVYYTYLQIRELPKWTDIRLGRQFVYSGVGSVLLDGGRLRLSHPSGITGEFFGGSSVSRLEPEKIRSISEFSTWGGRISYNVGPELRTSASWIWRESDGDKLYHAAGYQIEYTPDSWRLFWRNSYNILRNKFSEVLARADRTIGDWYYSAEFNSIDPSVRGNSLFSIIDFTPYRIFRVQVNRKLQNGMAVTSHVQVTFYEDENAEQLSLGISKGSYSFGVRLQDGYGGNNTGLYGSVNLQPRKYWRLYAAADLNRYRVQSLQDDLQDAYSVRLGVQWQIVKGTVALLEGQYLRNSIQNSDTRMLVRVSHGFSFKPSRKGLGR